jgi:hypothetical protein
MKPLWSGSMTSSRTGHTHGLHQPQRLAFSSGLHLGQTAVVCTSHEASLRPPSSCSLSLSLSLGQTAVVCTSHEASLRPHARCSLSLLQVISLSLLQVISLSLSLFASYLSLTRPPSLRPPSPIWPLPSPAIAARDQIWSLAMHRFLTESADWQAGV